MIKPEVTAKNSKSEILEAYENALYALQEARKFNKQEVKREQEKQTMIASAAQNTADSIVQELADLKLNLVKSLETIEGSLLAENKRLMTLQEAIKLQEKDLDDLYQIKMTANALEALLQAQKQKKETFEKSMLEEAESLDQEMLQKRLLWKQEQEQAISAWKEQESQQKKLKQREEEDYIYKRDLERKKEQDSYAMQKQALEKELLDKRNSLEQEFSKREADILAKEQELQNLRLQVAEAPKKLQQAIQDAEKLVTDKLQFKYEHESKLIQKEVEGEQKLHQQMIGALETKIKQQELLIRELTEKANNASLQVQQIAVKAIESASGQRFYCSNSSKNTETDKDVKA